MEQALISVIIPVYNTAAYLDECLRSVTGQSYSNLEILLIDDCSTDGSSKLLDGWAERDARIRVVHKERNSGVSDSRNLGLRLARGAFIAFVDSDDYIAPDFYENLYAVLTQSGADLVFGGYRRFDGERFADPYYPCMPTGTVETPVCLLHRTREMYHLFIFDKLYRRSALERDGALITFNTSYSYCEDVVWQIQVLLNCDSVTYWNGAGYYYRSQRPGNTLTAFNARKDMRFCDIALSANEEVLRLLQPVDNRAANNALQRVLYYRRHAIQTARVLGDREAAKRYGEGYFADLLRWLARDRTWGGVRWFFRQLGIWVLYFFQRLHRK